jgi:hypothetical protein
MKIDTQSQHTRFNTTTPNFFYSLDVARCCARLVYFICPMFITAKRYIGNTRFHWVPEILFVFVLVRWRYT